MNTPFPTKYASIWGMSRDAGGSGAEDAAPASALNSQPSAELAVVKVEEKQEEEDEMMRDVAALAGNGQSMDALATLESALRPIERYAVRFLEEVGHAPQCCFATFTALHLMQQGPFLKQILLRVCKTEYQKIRKCHAGSSYAHRRRSSSCGSRGSAGPAGVEHAGD